MLCYFKNNHGQVTEIVVETQETMREVVMKIEELADIQKVGINKIKCSCSCDNDLTGILLDGISEDISLNIQNDVDTSTEINLAYHKIKDSGAKKAKDNFELLKK